MLKKHIATVSIPFKRESVSKATPLSSAEFSEVVVFQFPSNGKAYPKNPLNLELEAATTLPMFQFPSNGKAYPKSAAHAMAIYSYMQVSIPFKRESVSKDHTRSTRNAWQTQFPFPSNGKAYPKENLLKIDAKGDRFPFPSNGKAYPKIQKKFLDPRFQKGFHSLQTGKRIQRQGQQTRRLATN